MARRPKRQPSAPATCALAEGTVTARATGTSPWSRACVLRRGRLCHTRLGRRRRGRARVWRRLIMLRRRAACRPEDPATAAFRGPLADAHGGGVYAKHGGALVTVSRRPRWRCCTPALCPICDWLERWRQAAQPYFAQVQRRPRRGRVRGYAYEGIGDGADEAWQRPTGSARCQSRSGAWPSRARRFAASSGGSSGISSSACWRGQGALEAAPAPLPAGRERLPRAAP